MLRSHSEHAFFMDRPKDIMWTTLNSEHLHCLTALT